MAFALGLPLSKIPSFRAVFVLLAVSNLAVSTWAAELTLTWSDNSDDETGFKIESSTDGSNFQQINSAGANAETYTDTDLVPGTQYWYRVRAYNAGGNSGYSNPASAVTAGFPPGNTPPSISYIVDRTIGTDGQTGAIAFTVSDAETAAGGLTVSGISSDATLVPLSGIVFGGSGSNRTVTVTPVAGQTGSVTVTVTVSDGELSDSESFTLMVGSAPGPVTFDYGLSNGDTVTFTAQDIGEVGNVGTTTYDSGSGVLTVDAGGVDIWDLADGFYFLWHQATGDFVTAVRVDSLTNPHQFAKVGIMIRESLDPDSIHATANLNPSGSANLVYRTTKGSSSSANSASVSAPAWVMLERIGNQVTASYSIDGANWTQIGQQTLDFSDTVYVGLATTAHTTTDTITAVFSGYDFVPAIPSPPENTAPTISNIADKSISTGGETGAIAFTVSDAETAAGGLTVVGSSSDATLVPVSGIVFGGSGSNRTVTVTPVAGQTGSVTVTVTVSDGELSDSETFTLVVGSDPGPVTFDYDLSNGDTVTFTAQDIGEVGNVGTTAYDSGSGVLTVDAGGVDIWDVADGFHFLWHQATGDFVTAVRVDSLTNPHQFAKAGIMIRESLDPDSIHATATIRPNNAANFIYRPTVGGSSSAISASVSAPAWVMLERIGNQVTASYSIDGANWTQIGQQTLDFSDTVYVGLATTAHTTTDTITAVFSGYDFVPAIPSPPENTAPTITNIADRTIGENGQTGVIAFAVSDAETAAGGLTVSGISSDATLVPVSGIVFGGSGSNRTVTVTPVAGQTGSVAVTMTVSDGELSDTESFTLTVTEGPLPVAVSISAPREGESFLLGDTVSGEALTSDISRTATVEFFHGSTRINTERQSPYTFNWSPDASGTYVIRAVATDTDGATTESPTVTVAVLDDTALSVTMTSPGDGTSIVLGESISVSAVVDVDVANVDHIDFYVGSTKIKAENLAPYQFSWTPDTVGSLVVTARGYNLAGTGFDSGSVTLDVKDPPLSVSLSAPSDGASYSFGEPVSVSAEVSDPDRTARVELLVDGSKIGEDAKAPYVILWSGAEAGSHTLQLRAIDPDGKSALSDVVTIGVGETPLTVSFVRPDGNISVEEGGLVLLEAITSDPSRTAKVDFYLDGSVIGSAESEPYRLSWKAQATGTHVVQAEAHENNGKKALSKIASITVTDLVRPIEIVVTTPTTSDPLSVGDDVVIEATVSNGSGVGRVEFLVNSVRIGQSNSAPYSTSWVPLEPGSYAIIARAVVPGGENVLSAPVSVDVEASTNPIDVPSGVYRGKFKKVRPGKDILDGTPVAEDEVTETGSFAIHVNEYGLMTFLGYDTDSETGFSSKGIRIAEDGSFEILGRARGSSSESSEPQVAPLFARGRIGAKGIEGLVDGTDLTISGILVNSDGPAASASGVYELMGVRTSDTLVQIIIGADGIAYAYSESDGVSTGDEVSVNLSEAGVYLASEVLALEVVIDTGEGSAQGLVTSPSGEVSSLMGLRDDIDPERRLLNISTRGSIKSGSNVMITGFVVSGTEPKTVLIRAIGPGLGEFGLSSYMTDPVLDLIGDGGTISSNARWILGNFGSVIESVSTRIGAFALAPDSLDAALLVTVAPGRYSAVVRDASRIGGDALVEVYDATDVAIQGNDLINLSTRGAVGGGRNLIGGFVVTGNVPERVLIRGIGPGLREFGVSDSLPSAKLVLTQRVEGNNILVSENLGWTSNPDPAAIISASESAGAFLLNSESDDSALLLWLEPGVYTAEVQPGSPGATGTALVEVYQTD